MARKRRNGISWRIAAKQWPAAYGVAAESCQRRQRKSTGSSVAAGGGVMAAWRNGSGESSIAYPLAWRMKAKA